MEGGALRRRITPENGGSILIVVLWTLFFMAALAAAAAAYVGAQVEAARRLGGQVTSRQAALAGVDHGLALLMRETNGWKTLSERWANSPNDFRDVTCGLRTSWTAYHLRQCADGSVATNYGLSDEQGRIDVNYARQEVLAALFRVTAGLGTEQAATLAKRIAEARVLSPPGQPGAGIAGSAWTSGNFENGPFRSVYELLWIRGVTRDCFDRIAPYITVHGGTRVNINTAGPVVLRVLAAARGQEVSDDSIRKILQFREGGGIFRTFFGAGSAGAAGDGPTLPAEAQAILSGMASYATVTSDRFRGCVVAGQGAGRVGITFVWDRRERRFLYWHED